MSFLLLLSSYLFFQSDAEDCLSPVTLGLITPIPKKGDTFLIDNLRPITITHTAGKVLESYVGDFIEAYLDSNSIIGPLQMGFRRGFSTADAVSNVRIDLNVNNGDYSLCAFLDLKKTFDCVDDQWDGMTPVGLLHLKIFKKSHKVVSIICSLSKIKFNGLHTALVYY